MLSGESDIGTRPKSMNRKLPDEGKDDPILGQSEFPVPGGVQTKAGRCEDVLGPWYLISRGSLFP